MRELILKIKLMLISFGIVNEITTESRYYGKLKKHNIRLFESKRKIYVVWEDQIVLKSIVQHFEIICAEERAAIIFKIWDNYKEKNQVYEINEYGCEYLDFLSGYEDFIHIKERSLILVREGALHSLIYNYEVKKVILDERRPVYWLEESKLFVKKVSGYWQLLFPKLVDGYTVWEKKKDFSFSAMPNDIFRPQLIGEKVIKLSIESADILDEFEKVKEVSWLPKPYTHLAREDGCLYMIGITSDDYKCLEIEGNNVKPLAKKIPSMQNYMVVLGDNIVTIVEYDEEDDYIKELESFNGMDIKLSDPELDIKAGCIKIPLKVLQERFLNE